MRLHHLSVTAFGPFAGTETVDFDPLHDAGLFLLHGPTGAGKTSILDAVGFALFGKVPGARQSARRLRSDHAPDHVPTTVVLDLTLRARRMRITRSPEQMRPARRGDGLVKQQASILLEELRGDSWHCLSTRLDEAGAMLTDEVGMSAEQFFQVALLPQGQFARFLHSTADERSSVLQRLFDTSRFAQARGWLEALRREEADEASRLRAVVNQVLARAAQAAGLDALNLDEIRDNDPEGWLRELLERSQAAETASADHSSEARAQVTSCAADLAASRDLAQRQQRLRLLQTQQQQLREREPTVTGYARAIERHGRALLIRPAVELREEIQRRHRDATEDRRRALEELAAHGHDVGEAADALASLAETTLERSGGLAALVTLERGMDQRAQSLAALRRQVTAHEAARQSTQARLAELPARQSGLLRALDQAQQASARSDGERRDLRDLTQRHSATQRLADMRRGVRRGDEAALQAAKDLQAVKERHLALREEWFAGTVAALATSLSDHQPCPVCGSCEHPAPASAEATTTVTRAELDAAFAEVEELEAARRDSDAALAIAQAELAACVVAAGGHGVDPERLAEQLTAAQQTLAETQARAAQESELRETLAELQAEMTTLTGDRDRAVVDLGRSQAQLEHDSQAFRDDTARLESAREGAASVALRRAQLQEVAAAADAARGAARLLEDLASQLSEASLAVEQAAIEAEFADAAEAEAALLAPEDLTRAEVTVRDAAKDQAGIEALLADPALADVSLDVVADTAGAAARLAEAEAEAERLSEQHATASHRRRQLAVLQGTLGRALAELRPAQERAATVRALADLAAGGGANRLKMPMEAFVLAARLEQVAEAASVRLGAMSGGRYRLQHCDEKRGRGRSGLGLTVFDAWTGRERDTATLSGGETFQASLALALGLADVVQRESGGLSIDTLFIDEGFGSLDPDTLERVMDTLDGLREGGRVVGVVSHVGELQQRISTRVCVHQDSEGSVVEQVA